MAKFVSVSSTGIHHQVNADTVRFVTQTANNQDQCTLHFDSDPRLTVGVSADGFVMMANK
ncbi:MAG: hypothetical protein WA366_03725 [Pseudolabrys sp.]